MKMTTILALILLVFSAHVFSQVESAPKKRSSFIQVDKDLSKIFGEKKEKKPKKANKEKKKKEVVTKPSTPSSSLPSVPSSQPAVEVTALNDNLSVGMMPKFYKKRSSPVLNIGLLYYGDHYTDEGFAQVQELLERRFEDATNGMLKLNVIFRAILPFKNQIQNFPDYKQDHVTDMKRLQRLWYYDNKDMSVVNEIYQEAKSHNLYGKDFSQIDALAVVTGAQFNGLGFASGRVAITENPMEIAWGLEGGGSVEVQSDAKVVDELIHELGHTLSIGHAADQCFGNGVTYEQTQACCAASENKNDVLSYCRQRNLVDENFFYGFEACNLKTIKEKVIPAMLNGGEWQLQDVEKCE